LFAPTGVGDYQDFGLGRLASATTGIMKGWVYV
jgi:hypothetical protein